MKTDWKPEELEKIFSGTFRECIDLMLDKNHDYGNSWAKDRPSTISDTIRHKIERIINIENLRVQGKETRVSEGIKLELKDIINYCVFRLIMEDSNGGT